MSILHMCSLVAELDLSGELTPAAHVQVFSFHEDVGPKIPEEATI